MNALSTEELDPDKEIMISASRQRFGVLISMILQCPFPDIARISLSRLVIRFDVKFETFPFGKTFLHLKP